MDDFVTRMVKFWNSDDPKAAPATPSLQRLDSQNTCTVASLPEGPVPGTLDSSSRWKAEGGPS